jgi:hypothetical protein
MNTYFKSIAFWGAVVTAGAFVLVAGRTLLRLLGY